MFTHTTTVSKPFLVPKTQTPLPIRLITIKTENKIADQEKSLIDAIAETNKYIAICTSLDVANVSANYIKKKDVDIGVFSGKGRHLHVKPNTLVTPSTPVLPRPYMMGKEFKENVYNDVVETVKSAKDAGYTRIVVSFTNENQIPDSISELKRVIKTVHDEECVSHVFFTEGFIQEVNKKLPFIVSDPVNFLGITKSLENRNETFDLLMHEVWTSKKKAIKFIPLSNKLPCADRLCQELFGKQVTSSLGSSTVTIGESMEKIDSQILSVYTKSSTISIRISDGMLEVNLPHTTEIHHILLWEYGTSTITKNLKGDDDLFHDLDGESVKAQDVMEMYLFPQADTVSHVPKEQISNREPAVMVSQMDDAMNIALNHLVQINDIYFRIKNEYAQQDKAKLNVWLDLCRDIGHVDIVTKRFPIFLDKTGMIKEVIEKMLECIPCQKKAESKRSRITRQTSVAVPFSPPRIKRARFDLNDFDL